MEGAEACGDTGGRAAGGADAASRAELRRGRGSLGGCLGAREVVAQLFGILRRELEVAGVAVDNKALR